MKNSSVKLFALATFVAAASLSLRADDMVRYRAKPGASNVRIDGVANVHKWKMEGKLIGGYVEIPAAITLDSKQATVKGAAADGKIPIKADVAMPVTSIQNGEWSGMDDVMRDAMGAATYPEIQYHLTQITLKQPHTAGTPFQFDATGELSLHGVTNKISMPVTIESLDESKLKIVGQDIPVSMTDYGIKPPVKALVFTTEPGVKISFDWVVGLPKKK